MNPDKLTIKTHEALLEAKDLATKSGHPSLGPLHLLFALVQQEEGVVAACPREDRRPTAGSGRDPGGSARQTPAQARARS